MTQSTTNTPSELDRQIDPYARYMDRLTGALVWIVLGAVLFLISMAKGMEYMVVESAGEWVRMDIASPNAFFGALLLGVLGIMLLGFGVEIAYRSKRRYDYSTRGKLP